MIKLIASDIDGPLVHDGTHELNPELCDVILQLKEKGIQFAAASGRQWASIEDLFDPINLFLNTIDRGLVIQLIQEIRKRPELEVMVSGPDYAYMDTKDEEFADWMINGYKFQVKRVEDLTKVDDQFIKISAYKKHGVQEATESLREQFGDRLKMTISGDMWMDCMAIGVSKGQAIKILQESLEIKPEETMVFGDQLNDLEMIRQAYYSFAVANARPEVKAEARFEADSNMNDGVLKILKLLV